MIHLLYYEGNITNWYSLCQRLEIDSNLPKKKREQEIIKRSYEKWKFQLGLQIYGMFTFVLWDDLEKLKLCMRDPFGQKPLYYYQTTKNELLTSSSISEIVQHKDFQKSFNCKALQLYLSFTYLPGEETFFNGLRKLPSGSYLLFQNGRTETYRYWQPVFHPDHAKTDQEWVNQIHDTFTLVMKELAEDVPSVVFLSSGVDSSYIAAMSHKPLCLSCGFGHFHLDESHIAEKTSMFLKQKYACKLITPEEYFSAIPHTICALETPSGDASAPALFLLCQQAAEYGTVCFSGEGADEFFGGYYVYDCEESFGTGIDYIGNTNIMKEDDKIQLLKNYSPEYLPVDIVKKSGINTTGLTHLSHMLAVDIGIWLDGNICFNVDRLCRATGMESRMPFLDLRIFDIACRIPDELKICSDIHKYILRMCALKVIPREMAFQKKIGFALPIRDWLKDPSYNKDVLRKFHSKYAEQFFRVDQLDQLWNEFINSNSALWRKIYTIYIFLVWYEEFYEKISEGKGTRI